MREFQRGHTNHRWDHKIGLYRPVLLSSLFLLPLVTGHHALDMSRLCYTETTILYMVITAGLAVGEQKQKRDVNQQKRFPVAPSLVRNPIEAPFDGCFRNSHFCENKYHLAQTDPFQKNQQDWGSPCDCDPFRSEITADASDLFHKGLVVWKAFVGDFHLPLMVERLEGVHWPCRGTGSILVVKRTEEGEGICIKPGPPGLLVSRTPRGTLLRWYTQVRHGTCVMTAVCCAKLLYVDCG